MAARDIVPFVSPDIRDFIFVNEKLTKNKSDCHEQWETQAIVLPTSAWRESIEFSERDDVASCKRSGVHDANQLIIVGKFSFLNL
jgi:hypothetical protein